VKRMSWGWDGSGGLGKEVTYEKGRGRGVEETEKATGGGCEREGRRERERGRDGEPRGKVGIVETEVERALRV